MNRHHKLLLNKTANLNNTIFLALLFAVTAFFIMPAAIQQLKSYVPDSERMDSLLFYWPDEAFDIISEYDARGRQLYLIVELSADLFFSITYALFIGSFLIWANTKLERSLMKIEYLFWIPVMSAIANCLENLGIIVLLISYADSCYYLALLTSCFTFLKWLFFCASFGIAIWYCYHFFMHKFSTINRGKQETSEDNL